VGPLPCDCALVFKHFPCHHPSKQHKQHKRTR
jgi:hypothetical protein